MKCQLTFRDIVVFKKTQKRQQLAHLDSGGSLPKASNDLFEGKASLICPSSPSRNPMRGAPGTCFACKPQVIRSILSAHCAIEGHRQCRFISASPGRRITQTGISVLLVGRRIPIFLRNRSYLAVSPFDATTPVTAAAMFGSTEPASRK
ncbi:MAG: hypothetical protein Ct9H300mP19_08520 [Dehalococcoidia bacterium]|nr:MAG: hypothetical protein Ct9H300mP19_08520 [Dehalococcoidia bacterium]